MSLFIFTKVILLLLFYLILFINVFLESYFIFSCSGMFQVLSTPLYTVEPCITEGQGTDKYVRKNKVSLYRSPTVLYPCCWLL